MACWVLSLALAKLRAVGLPAARLCLQSLLWERSCPYPRRKLLDSRPISVIFLLINLSGSRASSRPACTAARPTQALAAPPGVPGLRFVRQSYAERRSHSADRGGGESRPPFTLFTLELHMGSLKTGGRWMHPWER